MKVGLRTIGTWVLLTFGALTGVRGAPPPAGIAPVLVPSGGFAIDGDLVANKPAAKSGDWVLGTGGGTGAGVLDAAGVPLDPSTTFHFIDAFNSNADLGFAGGAKWTDNPNDWQWTSGKASSKTDINNVLMHVASDANGHTWTIVAADRLSTSGDSYIDFEFLQNPMVRTNIGTNNVFVSSGPNGGRTTNDMVLSLAFTGGGSTADFFAWRWQPNGSGGFSYVDVTGSLPVGRVFVALNSNTIAVPYGAFGNNTYDANAFAEAAIDLTALVANFDPCRSLGFRTIMVKTKTSQSSSATIVDFIDPIQYSLRIGPSADAGADQARCLEGASTAFALHGVATPGQQPIVSTAWSVVSGTATIDAPASLITTAHVASASATLRLTVQQANGCTETNDVVLTVLQPPPCSITGRTVMCPNSFTVFEGMPGMRSYSWSVTGNGASVAGSGQALGVVAGRSCGDKLTIRLTNVDTNGCSSSCSLDVMVGETSPVVLVPPADVVQQCPGDTGTNVTGVAMGIDGCSAVTVSYSDIVSNFCGFIRTIRRTWRATDACGNSTNAVQTIAVLDSTPRTIIPPADVVLACPADTRTNVTGAATATGGCGLLTVSYSEVVSNSCGVTRTIRRTWTATDPCGNSVNAVQTISVIDTIKPIISCPSLSFQCVRDLPPAYSSLSAFLSAGGTASDTCSSALKFSLTSDSGLVGKCPGSVTRVYRVTDDCGNFAECSQVITFNDTIAPVLNCPSNLIVECGASLDAAGSATDNCSPSPTLTITHTDVSVPSQYDFKFYVADPDTNTGPYSKTYLEFSPASLPCPAEAVVNGRALDPLRNAVAFAPGGALDALTSIGNVPMGFGQIVPFEVVIQASGGPGPEHGTIEFTANWSTYTTSNNRFGYDTNYMVYCAFVDAADPGTIDPNYNARVVSYTSKVINRGTATEAIQGTFRVAGLDDGDRVIIEVWMVLDSSMPDHTGGTVAATLVSAQTVATPPVQMTVGTQTDSLGNLSKIFPLPPPQQQPPLGPLPPQPPALPGATISAIDRTWTATDDCGNSSTCVQRITVRDTRPPVIVCQPDRSVIAPDSLNFDQPTATDTCGSATVHEVSTVTNTLAQSILAITRTWEAVDASGNTARCQQTITYYLVQPPVIQPGSQTVQEGGDATFNVTASGNPPFVYQWRCNGTNLPGATDAPLILNGVQLSDAGLISVLVSNADGTIGSAPAVLNVMPALDMQTNGAGFTLTWAAPFILQWATDNAGPYIDVPGATSPYYYDPAIDGQKFFKLRAPTFNLSVASVSGGKVNLNIPSVPGCNVIIQASADLINWSNLQTNLTPCVFSDDISPQRPRRFYRATLAP